jgi:hypothetical protein
MWVELSGKMHVLARLLGHLRQKTNDRIVLVSNYTQVRYFWYGIIVLPKVLVDAHNSYSKGL